MDHGLCQSQQRFWWGPWFESRSNQDYIFTISPGLFSREYGNLVVFGCSPDEKIQSWMNFMNFTRQCFYCATVFFINLNNREYLHTSLLNYQFMGKKKSTLNA